MRSLSIVCVLGACGGGGYDISPRVPDDECPTFDCAIAAGTEVLADPMYYSDIKEYVDITAARVTPTELASVRVDKNVIVLQARAASGTMPAPTLDNTGTLGFTTTDGDRFDRPIRVEPIASTTVVPDRYELPYVETPERLYRDNHMAMFVGGSMLVVAQHRGVDGQRLLGHGSESWTVAGVGELAELQSQANDYTDAALVRAVSAPAAGQVRVSAGGPELVIDALPPGSTTRVELDRFGSPLPTMTLTLMKDEFATVSVLAFAGDLFIQGAKVTATSSDPSIVEVSADSRPSVSLSAKRQGGVTVGIDLDGIHSELDVVVE